MKKLFARLLIVCMALMVAFTSLSLETAYAVSNPKPCGAIEPGKIKTGAVGASGTFQTGYTNKNYKNKEYTWSQGGTKYKTVLVPTGTRYFKMVKKVGEWKVAHPGVTVTTSNTSSSTMTISAIVSSKLSAGINLEILAIASELSASLGFTTSLEKTTTKSESVDLGQLNPGNRYCFHYYMWLREYNMTTYRYNKTTKKYDTKVTTVGGRKVTGLFYEPDSSPTRVLMWGYAN